MRFRRPILTLWTCALLAACSGALPGPASPTPNAGGGGGTGPAATGQQATAAPGVGGGGGSGPATTPPPAGPAGTIRGTITFHAQGRTVDPVSQAVVENLTDATFDVRLVRDTSAEDERYVDDGSTYDVSVLITTELPGAECVATSRSETSEKHAFADRPTSYVNSIEANVLRGEGLVLIASSYSWTLHITGNDCDGRAPTDVETSGGLDCPFGLMAKLIEGPASDQIDVACTLPGGETYSGILTLTR